MRFAGEVAQALHCKRCGADAFETRAWCGAAKVYSGCAHRSRILCPAGPHVHGQFEIYFWKRHLWTLRAAAYAASMLTKTLGAADGSALQGPGQNGVCCAVLQLSVPWQKNRQVRAVRTSAIYCTDAHVYHPLCLRLC